MSAPVILVTFAGREKRMSLLSHYVKKAIQDGVIDEWHIWDFTRHENDTLWLAQEFPSLAFISDESPYQKYQNIIEGENIEFSLKCPHDFHFAFTVEDYFYECVIGGWSNRLSVVRKVKKDELFSYNRQDDVSEIIWEGHTTGILSPAVFTKINIIFRDNNLYAYIDGSFLFQIDNVGLNMNSALYIRGGYGGAVELENHDKIKRFAGVPKELAPYYRAYNYYAKRYEQYKDHVFLKCDDDIVYMDYKKLNGFIEFRQQQPQYFLVSANVLNNGYCAFLQQQAGYIPTNIGNFEMPHADDAFKQTGDIELQPYSLGCISDKKWPRELALFESHPYGFHGSLWGSGQKAIDLHNFFLSQDCKTLHLPRPVVEWPHYVSINFISWLGRDLKYMAIGQIDDERAFSIEVPRYLNRQHAFYSDFMVSHLSFQAQEEHFDFEEILRKYEDFASR